MKLMIRLTSLILVLVTVFTLGVAGCSKDTGTASSYSTVPVNENLTFTPMTADNDYWTYENPDRGYRSEMLLRFKQSIDGTEDDWRTMAIDDGMETNKKKVRDLFQMYLPGKMEYKSKLIIFYIILEGFNDQDIPQEVLDILDYAFELCRIYKVKVLFRIGYHLHLLNFNLSDENKQILADACATEEWMLKHIDQLAPFISKNKEVIHKMSSGFIGFAGEMAYNYQYPSVNYNTIIKAVVEKICVPNDLYYSVRLPDYKLDLLAEDQDYEYAHYIGFNNDAIFGEQTRSGWNSGGFQVGKRAWTYVSETAAYTPQSGEMLVNSVLVGATPERCPKGIEVITELAHHRYTTFSQWHTLYENWGKDNVIQRWIDNEVVTSEMLDDLGIIYDPNWFVDDEGNEVNRNPYEFIRDHLGYRLVAGNAEISGNVGIKEKVNVKLNFKNYGFAAAFYMTSGFAILNDKYEVVSTVDAGDPVTWHSHDPDDYTSTEVLDHSVSAELTLPETGGKFYIAFYLKNSMNDYAALSNSDIPFEGDGFNILKEIEIK